MFEVKDNWNPVLNLPRCFILYRFFLGIKSKESETILMKSVIFMPEV